LKIYIKFKYNNITNYLIDYIYLSVYEEVSFFIETIYKDFKLLEADIKCCIFAKSKSNKRIHYEKLK